MVKGLQELKLGDWNDAIGRAFEKVLEIRAHKRAGGGVDASEGEGVDGWGLRSCRRCNCGSTAKEESQREQHAATVGLGRHGWTHFGAAEERGTGEEGKRGCRTGIKVAAVFVCACVCERCGSRDRVKENEHTTSRVISTVSTQPGTNKTEIQR